MEAVLVLNADYSLLEIVSWQKAIMMILQERVRLVEEYANRVIRSATKSFPFPAVVVRTRYVKARKKIRFSRRNVIARDGYTCQYCGKQPLKSSGAPCLESLTIDHVVPRAQARKGWVRLPWSGQKVRVTSWSNVLTACEPCNTTKADRTPRQAGMRMTKVPQVPSPIDIAWIAVFRHRIPEEWELFLPLKASTAA